MSGRRFWIENRNYNNNLLELAQLKRTRAERMQPLTHLPLFSRSVMIIVTLTMRFHFSVTSDCNGQRLLLFKKTVRIPLWNATRNAAQNLLKHKAFSSALCDEMGLGILYRMRTSHASPCSCNLSEWMQSFDLGRVNARKSSVNSYWKVVLTRLSRGSRFDVTTFKGGHWLSEKLKLG